ncbi:MAG: 5-(carboxyamino)imidazole ribonucleotide synthase [Bdellovibrionales bacterium]|nr:5-(carboxyamino)imidazole ribonucleotide synthase [Bdellovibrionales bacterium]
MKNRLSKVRLGILGGGQLARMMALRCHEMGIKPYILSSHPQDPAAQVTSDFVQGNPNTKRDIKNFLNKVDLAVFENEFIDPTILHEASIASDTPVHPQPKIMNLLQDRLNQKNLLKKYKIPTARFIEIDSSKQIKDLTSLFPKGFVLKKRHQGYDGYGTLIVKNIAKEDTAKEFIDKNPHLIAEELIPFKKELAIILVRNRKEQIVELPLVETYQEEACCLWVKGPCRHQKKDSLVKKLKNMLNQISYDGVMAFELFETKQGLLVNEIAPRVHNSGHYSMDALSEDQFTLHIKAVLNMNISPPKKLSGGFAMLNLLGQKTSSQWLPPAETTLHWYGKMQTRIGRKMGHLNSLNSTSTKALTTLLDFKKKFL